MREPLSFIDTVLLISIWASIIACILASLAGTQSLGSIFRNPIRLVVAIVFASICYISFDIAFIIFSVFAELIFAYLPGVAGSKYGGQIATAFQVSSSVLGWAIIAFLGSKILTLTFRRK